MRHRLVLAAGIAAIAAAPMMAEAQIACARATSPINRAICGSLHLLDCDRELAAAYGEALRRRPRPTW
ncbi:MAG: hypothetical protein JWP20_818 [Roseomonas sp.]|nr:hypothetical protein [Roseomonas sp.]